MSSPTKKSKTTKVSDTDLVKSPKKYSKKQAVSPQTSLKRVPEKKLQLSKEVSIKHINQEKLFFEKASLSPLVSNMSQLSPSKSIQSSKEKGTTLSKNGFLEHQAAEVSDPVDLYGKDWDEMEFLGSSSAKKHYNTVNDSGRTTNEALNGKYARTRKNLGQKMSAEIAVGNGFVENSSILSSKPDDKHLTSNATKPISLKKLTKQSSVMNSPMKSTTPLTTLKSSSLPSLASSSKEHKPSLLDMVKKFSAGANPSASDSTTNKAASKSSSSFIKYLNKIRSEPPRAVSDVSLKSLVPDSIEISLVPSALKSPSKDNSLSSVNNHNLKVAKQVRKQPILPNSLQIAKSDSTNKDKQRAKKRSSEVGGNTVKKSKSTRNELIKSIDETINSVAHHSFNVTDVMETSRVSDKEISCLDKEIVKETKDLKNDVSSSVNCSSQVVVSDTGLRNVINPPPTSYIFTPTIPNSFSTNLVQTSASNNLIYDVNSLSLYPPVAPPSTTVFILPVTSNFSAVPPGNGSVIAPPSQPIIKLSCNGMDADSVFKSICKNFYQPVGTSIQNSENVNHLYHRTSNNIIQTNSVVHTSLNASSTTSTQPLETCSNNLLIPRTRSNAESDVREVSTMDRSSLLLSYFCELIKNNPKLPLEEYVKEANEVLDVLSSFPHYLSVKYFCNNTEEYFSDLCFCDSSSQSTAFEFDGDFQESRLNEVLKKYVSFQMKEIVRAFPSESFCVKSNLIFKAGNSKLTYFEKLILKKMLKSNQEVALEELIGRLFFVGLVVVFSAWKKQKQL